MEYIDIYDDDRKPLGITIPREDASLPEGQYMLYVLAVLQNEEGKYLITQRANKAHWGYGWWEVSGGAVLAGETAADAIVREVREEVGLDVSGVEGELLYSYKNIDAKHGHNYITDIYCYQLDFSLDDVVLQPEEAGDGKLATWPEIEALGEEGIFLHFARLKTALGE